VWEDLFDTLVAIVHRQGVNYRHAFFFFPMGWTGGTFWHHSIVQLCVTYVTTSSLGSTFHFYSIQDDDKK
jgi:hypothetical protein